MAARFFGQFLLERGLIEADALLRAVEHQNAHNLKLGELAVREGLLTVEDADAINREQRRLDAQFGRVATSLGKLTASQVDELVKKQKAQHIFIGQAIVAVGALGQAQLDEALAIYKKEEDQARIQIDLSKNTITWTHAPAFATMVQLTGRLLQRVADVVTKEGAPREEIGKLPPAETQVAVTLRGGFNGDYVLRMPLAIAKQIACRMLDEKDPPAELIRDANREFANVVCGQVCAALPGVGIELSAPRELAGNETVALPGRKVAIFPLSSADALIEVAIIVTA